MVAELVGLLAALTFAPQLHEGDAVPAIPLVDQDNRAFSLQRLEGRAVVLSFIFTRCTDRCALTAARLSKLARDGDPHRVAVVALTVDPEHDTPAVLSRYRAGFDGSSRLTLATGASGPLLLLERRLGADPSTDASRIEHADLVVVLDRRGRIATFVSGSDWSPLQVEELAAAVYGASADPTLALQLWLAAAVARCGQAATALSAGAAIALVLALTLAIALPLVAGALRG